MTRRLILYETYARRDVHDLFEPGTRFIPQAGTWGLWGIVPIPDKAGDFVFFVTFGKEQAGHHFDEWVSEKGVINWQSQPRQTLADRQIQKLIHHDPTKNNIYLFLRTEKTGPYTYLGRLAYHAHDPERERPVYIQWQILGWNPPPVRLQAMGLTLRSEEPQPAPQATSTVSFEWRGFQYPVNREALRARIQQQIRVGLPSEALRFRDWYVEMEGRRLSAKWIFHLITGADYSEFDAPTARNKLEKMGIPTYPVFHHSGLLQSELAENTDGHLVKDGTMYRSKYYKFRTITGLVDLLQDLILLGEVMNEQKNKYLLTDYHYLVLLESGLVLANPKSLVASSRLINMLPLDNVDELLSILNLSIWDGNSWPNLPEKAFNLVIQDKHPLDHRYAITPKHIVIYEDNICRPVFLYDYLAGLDEWEDWTIDAIAKVNRIYTEPKLFVHSTLPIQNIYGGLAEVQDAVWKTALYWTTMQLLILSDSVTGGVYDPQISIRLSDGWRDGSVTRLYLQGEYIGDLADCLEGLLEPFHWLWVNRSDNAAQNHQAILGLLRLLLKVQITELDKDGRLHFSDHYRSQMFESQSKAQLYYRSSKDARDKLREAIKEMSR